MYIDNHNEKLLLNPQVHIKKWLKVAINKNEIGQRTSLKDGVKEEKNNDKDLLKKFNVSQHSDTQYK